jgi:hypothetical protein
MVVPTEVMEMYKASPENRKSVTVCEAIRADGSDPPPPFIIVPGIKIMEAWIAQGLVGPEAIQTTPTGYTNNEVALQYLEHLIKHLRAGPTKPWKILLLDSHESHTTYEFQLLAQNNHIYPFYYPSHLTHALQPLDVGIFRPWKHYHKMAIANALRNLEFDYSISSFFRDLTSIRQDTFKYHTIINSFKDSGMWPPSYKQGIKKVRSYKKSNKRTIDDVNEQDDLELPRLPPSRPTEIWDTTAKVREFGDRDPTKFSDNSREVFKHTMKAVDIQLQKAHLTTIEHGTLQAKLIADGKRKIISRRTVVKGGGAPTVDTLRVRIKERNEKENAEKLRKARKKLDQAKNKQKNHLLTLGIQARKDNKARIARLQEAKVRNELPVVFEDILPIREPDKDPTAAEILLTTDEGHEGLVQVIRELEQLVPLEVEQDDEVNISTQTVVEKEEEVPEYRDSSPVDQSEVESIADSIDSIQNNADFVLLE